MARLPAIATIEDLVTLTATTGVRTAAKSDERSLNGARTITRMAIDSTFIAIVGTSIGEHRSVTRGRAAAAVPLSSNGLTKGTLPPVHGFYYPSIIVTQLLHCLAYGFRYLDWGCSDFSAPLSSCGS